MFLGWFFFPKETKYKTTVFAMIESDAKETGADSREMSAVYFGETVVGWFRDSGFLSELNMSIGAKVSAYKQERQNMIIESISFSKEESIKNAEKSLEIIESRMNTIDSLNQYRVIVLSMNTKESLSSYVWYQGGFTLGGLVFLVLLYAQFSFPVKKERFFRFFS
jgi:hypothetical protein